MSNITNSNLFKRIGAGPYLEMLAKREENIRSVPTTSGNRQFNSIFDNSNICHEINQIVNTHSLNNYYEYTAEASDICNNIIYFPREFYITGINLIPKSQTSNTSITDINIYFDTNSISFNNSKKSSNGPMISYPVEKIEKHNNVTVYQNPSQSQNLDFKISFKGFM